MLPASHLSWSVTPISPKAPLQKQRIACVLVVSVMRILRLPLIPGFLNWSLIQSRHWKVPKRVKKLLPFCSPAFRQDGRKFLSPGRSICDSWLQVFRLTRAFSLQGAAPSLQHGDLRRARNCSLL